MLIFSEICILAGFQFFHKEPGNLEFRPNVHSCYCREESKHCLPIYLCVLQERIPVPDRINKFSDCLAAT